MADTFRLGYRRKGQSTWHPITVNLDKSDLQRITKMYRTLPKDELPSRGIPKDAIFIAKEVRRLR